MPSFVSPVRARLVFAGAVLGVAGLCLSACGSSSPADTAKSLMQKALKDATKAGWVHEVGLETEGSKSLQSDNHIATASGSSSVDDEGALAKVLLVGGVAYIEGNEDAVLHYFGLPAKHPAALAGKWLSIESSNSGFTQVSASVTLAGDFAQYTLGGKVTKSKDVVVDGRKATPIYGTVSGKSTIHATLYVTTTGTILPIEITVKDGPVTSVIKWDAWGDAVVLTKPASSIPITTVLK
jgi:hypothetical protein